MKVKCSFLLIGLIIFLSCEQAAKEIPPHQDVNALFDRFHGKYKILSSTSSEAIDLNLDLKSSQNMLREIPGLSKTFIDVLVFKEVSYENNHPKLMIEYQWMHQEFGENEPIKFDPKVSVYYPRKVALIPFQFNEEVTQFLLEQEASIEMGQQIFNLIESVKILENDHLEIIQMKKLYSSGGWKTLEIKTIYERIAKKSEVN
jgi:hypothetical protein